MNGWFTYIVDLNMDELPIHWMESCNQTTMDDLPMADQPADGWLTQIVDGQPIIW